MKSRLSKRVKGMILVTKLQLNFIIFVSKLCKTGTNECHALSHKQLCNSVEEGEKPVKSVHRSLRRRNEDTSQYKIYNQ